MDRRRPTTAPDLGETHSPARSDSQPGRLAPDVSRFTELDNALELIYFGFRGIIKEPDKVLEARGLGRVHHRILYFVRRNPGLCVGDLLEILGVTKQSLHRPMQQLIEKELLIASRSLVSGRVKILALTRAGLALEARLSSLQRRTFERAFASVPAGDERAWREIMHALR